MPPRPRSDRRPGRRVTLSREQIVETAIAVLDRDGIGGLTLRGLAAELGGGLGSVYWHVDGKAELIELACDELIGRALEAAGPPGGAAADVPSPPMEVDLETSDPVVLDAVDRLRRMAMALFWQLDRHPWLAVQSQAAFAGGSNGLLVWERLGRPLADLGLTPRQQFHGSTALMGYVLGVASVMAEQGAGADRERSQEEQLEDVVEGWLADAPEELTWVRSVADEFVHHDDVAQFSAGLDLLLLGLVRQALAG
ncbi:TetR/AcrR family transcriptional regulator [Nocardioides sp.]|uniref:TetR/AcrR family transcriptional regulator n=1 Tax=Nocardioides sp. TaxID=35761 RepID=UPI00352736E0